MLFFLLAFFSGFAFVFPVLFILLTEEDFVFDLFADLVDEALENLSEILQGDVTKENVEKYLHMTDNKDEDNTE